MGRLIVWAGLVAGCWWLINWVGLSPGLEISGREIVLEARDLEYRFTRQAGLSADWMLFGGDNGSHPNQMTDVTLAALGLDEARLIARSYPDFHLCKSPGAAQAKGYVETRSVIGASREAKRTLSRAVDLFEERLRSGGERTCLHLEGAEISLDSVRLLHDGSDISDQVLPGFEGRTRFTLAERVELQDCATLLR